MQPHLPAAAASSGHVAASAWPSAVSWHPPDGTSLGDAPGLQQRGVQVGNLPEVVVACWHQEVGSALRLGPPVPLSVGGERQCDCQGACPWGKGYPVRWRALLASAPPPSRTAWGSRRQQDSAACTSLVSGGNGKR